LKNRFSKKGHREDNGEWGKKKKKGETGDKRGKLRGKKSRWGVLSQKKRTFQWPERKKEKKKVNLGKRGEGSSPGVPKEKESTQMKEKKTKMEHATHRGGGGPAQNEQGMDP